MEKIKIFKCIATETPTKLPKVIEKYNINYALANQNGIKMGELAEIMYKEFKSPWASALFCHTIEAQAFGAKVKLDYINGNRIVDYPISSIIDIDRLKIPNMQSKEIGIVLDSIKYLKNKNIPVSVDVNGPITLATSILPTEEVYKGMAKETKESKRLFQIIEDFLVEYINEILNLDIHLLSYADTAGTLDILGPKLYKKVSGPLYLGIVERIDFKGNTIIHMCPKSLTSLIAVNMIEQNENGPLWGGSCISKTGDISRSKRYRLKY